MAEERGCAPGPGCGPDQSGHGSERSVLVVVGALLDRRSLEQLLRRIEEGVRCWSVDLDVSSLDEQLKLFVSRHSAFLSEDVPGQRTLQHSGDILDTQVLLNPTHELVCAEVQRRLCSSFVYQLLLFVGVCEEETGELILQRGRFSCSDLLLLLNNTQVEALRALPVKPALTVCCPCFGCWSGPWEETLAIQGVVDVKVNPVPVLPLMEGLQEFTEYLSESLMPDSPFDLLEPPDAPGFLRLYRPCCYVFPGGRGDSAFFSVCGFNVLVNGGSDPRSCFWKLVRHLDRVDSVLLTHCGSDNLPGIISFLQRKLYERQENLDQTKNLISPEVGVVFFNTPKRLESSQMDPSKLRSCDLAEITLQLLQELSITPQPLSRVSGTIKPLILFQKLGVGCLELYTLNPVSSLVPSTDASICVLLVWHPADPQEKIVRVLFPGHTPQSELLEGLEILQYLQCLKYPSPCLKDLQTSRTEKELSPERAESRVQISLQREKCTEPKKTTPVPPDEKSKVREVDIKPRTSKPEKLLTRKDQKGGKVSTTGKKEEKKKEPMKKDLINTKPKKEPEPKRDLKVEPKRDYKKELKPGERKSVKTKDVRKAHGAPSEAGSDPPKTARSLRTDEISLKKAPLRKVDTKVEKEGAHHLEFNGLHKSPEKLVKDSTNGPSVKLDIHLSSKDSNTGNLNHNCEDESPRPCMSGPEEEKDLALHHSVGSGLEETISSVLQHVDVCLVSPCEFQHLHVPQSQDEGLESATPSKGGDLVCPIVAEGSEEEDGGALRLSDPAPTPNIDHPPPPTQPGSCTVDSEENPKTPSLRTRKPSKQNNSLASCSTGSLRTLPESETKISTRRAVSGTSRSKVNTAAGSRVPSLGPGSAGLVVYVDLVYLPSCLSSIDADLFRCLRSSHYVLSGDDPRREIGKVLDALLEGKSCWAEPKVTLIPTFESPVMHEWYQQTLQQQRALSLSVLGSSSTVAMQDECFPACKVELH